MEYVPRTYGSRDMVQKQNGVLAGFAIFPRHSSHFLFLLTKPKNAANTAKQPLLYTNMDSSQATAPISSKAPAIKRGWLRKHGRKGLIKNVVESTVENG